MFIFHMIFAVLIEYIDLAAHGTNMGDRLDWMHDRWCIILFIHVHSSERYMMTNTTKLIIRDSVFMLLV